VKGGMNVFHVLIKKFPSNFGGFFLFYGFSYYLWVQLNIKEMKIKTKLQNRRLEVQLAKTVDNEQVIHVQMKKFSPNDLGATCSCEVIGGKIVVTEFAITHETAYFLAKSINELLSNVYPNLKIK
jgi:hypothetical protein